MSPAIPQGTGFTTMPRGLSAEVEMDRYEFWREAVTATPALRRTTRVVLSGGPFDAWAWDVTLVPDRFVAEDGQYRPLLQSNQAIIDNEPVAYVWTPGDDRQGLLPRRTGVADRGSRGAG